MRLRTRSTPGLLLAGLLALMWSRHASPVTLPAPAGPFAVGRLEYDWVDQGRAETFGPGAGGKRELDVWVWYPAEAGAAQAAAPYLPGAWLTARSGTQQPALLADFLTQDPGVVHSHAIAGAPLAAEQSAYPVLVLQPGLGPILPDYTTLAEDLASRGYVVVGSTPTYSAAAAAFASSGNIRCSGPRRRGDAGGIPPLSHGSVPPPAHAAESASEADAGRQQSR